MNRRRGITDVVGAVWNAHAMTGPHADIIDELACDPLFQLSTANQELFHTNMLYWLIKTCPGASHPLMGAFGILPPQHIYSTVVAREWHHLDLFVDSGMGCGKLVLENKLHSLPRAGQLEGYYRGLPDTLHTDETAYILLSLIPPTFPLPDPWRYVDYAEILPPLKESAVIVREMDGLAFEADLLDRYVRLVEGLITVRDHHDVRSDPDRPVELGRVERERLGEARLLPLVEKLRVSGLVGLIRDRIGPDPDLGVDLTNTHGVVGHFVEGSSGHSFGWQYQAGQMRLAVVLADPGGSSWPNRAAREQLVQQQFADFFDFTRIPIPAESLNDYTGKLAWLGYEPNFVYRYRPIRPGMAYTELADVCTLMTGHVDRYAAAH